MKNLKIMIESLDWSKTSLGDRLNWSQALKTAVSMVLNCRFPCILFWGPDYVQIYNDQHAVVIGPRHPFALGQKAKDCWPEIWNEMAPMLDSAISEGKTFFLQDHLMFLLVNAKLEERYFTFSYSPVEVEDGRYGGVYCVVSETTASIIGERRLRLLRDFAARSVDTSSESEAIKVTMESVSENPYDIPFAQLYLTNHAQSTDTLQLDQVFSLSIPETALTTSTRLRRIVSHTSPTSTSIKLSEEVGQTTHDKKLAFENVLFEALSTTSTKEFDITEMNLPCCGAFNEAPTQCAILPVLAPSQAQPIGVIVIGINPRLPISENYSSFFNLVVSQVGTTISRARAQENERRRLQAMAELDRAKTTFFDNISHEFRTPLTLILGPLEDLLSHFEESGLDSSTLEKLNTIHRNTLRVLKLVNTLLNFSQIEAGKLQGEFERTDVVTLTRDIISLFKAACEGAGLHLDVDIEPFDDPVYVDTDMWEKIVVNLLSNAFKFTMNGGIYITLRRGVFINEGQEKLAFVLSVRDTGCGISSEELPNIFKRFHRAKSVQARSIEGTGIGLALVYELVKLHYGTLTVDSKVGEGTSFSIFIPLGSDHLQPHQIKDSRSIDSIDQQYTKQELLTSPSARVSFDSLSLLESDYSVPTSEQSCILVVDDNADMRDYIVKLLRKSGYKTISASDGQEAAELLMKESVDLVITDFMMPKMNGQELIQTIRNSPKTQLLPVILVSARAGEESKAEGLNSGADDYLTKPFSAKELIARTKTHLTLSKLRVQATLQAEQANQAKDHFLAMLSHELRTPMTPALMLTESLESNPDVPDWIKQDLQLISDNIKLQVKLIDDLLDINRITRGKLALSFSNVHLHELIGNTIQIVQHEIEEKKIQLCTNLDAKSCQVFGDSSRLHQIMWNLLKNAIKFTPSGGTITIVSANVNEDNTETPLIEISIQDTGIGMEPDKISRIFDAFEQGDSLITRKFGGLGLGLSISKALVKRHHGTLTAKSEGPGCGSTFTFTLPTAVAEEAGIVQSTNPKAITKSESIENLSKKVLIVEDNKGTMLVMCRMLQRLGHSVKGVGSVSSALAATAQELYDIVISDIGLPDGSGFELMEKLKSLYNIKGIAASGFGMREDIQKSKRAGFDVHLTKPIELAKLKAAIAELS